ncbi:MAG TPA: hypothetical protein VGO56_20985 [Pyrinomonadaceae bacterium]|jgi:hypothetical protein|nr:hypothetical protein [Pyrinomonadaceae bacterium]
MNNKLGLALRYRADSAFEASDTMLRVAKDLLKQGNQREAARLRTEALHKRNESVLLMDQARAVERSSSNILQFRKKSSDDERKEGAALKKPRSRLFRIR